MFSATREAFLTSMAPLVALPLVGSVLMLGSRPWTEVLADFFQVMCALLWPMVGSHFLARIWGREDAWLRYATTSNWCQWIVPLIAAAFMLGLGVAVMFGMPRDASGPILVFGVVFYLLWQHWFIARHGLGISGPRALILVGFIHTVTIAVVIGVALLGGEAHLPLLPEGERT